MSKALFAGTFDPITLGHLDIITQAASQYDHVTVGVFVNANKTCLLPLDTRLALIGMAVAHLPNVDVIANSGYTADYAKEHGYILVRGYRNETDLAYEEDMAAFNLARGGVKTQLLPTAPALREVSSTRVRDAIKQGDMEAVEQMVPSACYEILVALREKL